ncbi:MAG: RluA family pseudouridine synthase [Calditrichaeota bacterium]|nr:MAG: RluA family pseudouridine synthase [Calditrichota bacterium]
MAENKQIEIIVSESENDVRLDVFLSGHPELELSRTKVQKLVESGDIIVNSKTANKKQFVVSGDKIEISIAPPEESELIAENIPLEILYDDKYLAVVNKPAGMVTHPGAGNRSGTLVNALLYHFKNLSSSSDPERPGIVHRLDKDTSGLLLIAKDDNVYTKLQTAIQNRDVKRTYLALICGHVTEDIGEIDLPIGRSIKNRKKMTVTTVNSREAVTHFKLLNRYRTYDLLEVNLMTGRTHQIRVHFAHLGHPIFGDPDYGGRDKWHRGIFGPEKPLGKKILGIMKRQALHAQKLAFEHPVTKEKIELESKLPDDYNKLLNILNNEGV